MLAWLLAEDREMLWNPLLAAVQRRDRGAVVRLLGNGEDPDCRGFGGLTPLMIAAKGDATIVNALLTAGARVDSRDGGGNTALMYAAEAGAVECISVLLDAGADVNAASEAGVTPLMHTVRSGSPAAVEALLLAGSDRSRRDADGRTAWDHANLTGAGRETALGRVTVFLASSWRSAGDPAILDLLRHGAHTDTSE